MPHKHLTVAEVLDELKKLGEIAVPVAAMNIASYLRGMVSVACLGRLGEMELAGGALAVGFTNITGYSILSGLASGMEPLCSQGLGSGNSSLVSRALRRTVIMLLAASTPVALLWVNLPVVMGWLRQDPDVARIAGRYCLFAVPDLIATSLLCPVRVYLRCKGETVPLMCCTALAVLLHIVLTPLLCFGLRLGVPGVGLATSAANFNTLLFLLLHMFVVNRARTTTVAADRSTATNHNPSLTICPPPPPTCCWMSNLGTISPSDSASSSSDSSSNRSSTSSSSRTSTPTAAAATSCSISDTSCDVITSSTGRLASCVDDEWRSLLRLAIPSCLGVCLEWWWYELMTLASGYLPQPHVALGTSAIVIQTTSLMYCFPIALASSVSSRVGNELGAARPQAARVAALTAMGAATAVSCVCLMFATVFCRSWAGVFTSDPAVLKLAAVVLPLIGLCELGNCPQTTGCGVLRGCARPTVAAGINLYSFYLVGAPLAAILAFPLGMGLAGLCYGLLGAQAACALSIAVVIYRTDWDRESYKARALVGPAESGAGDSTDEDAVAGMLLLDQALAV